MNDYFGGRSRDDLEKLLRRLVDQGAEGPKLDFKAAIDLDKQSGHAEVAKDISSIANTDDESRLDDIGYIIVGAERGRIIGTTLFDGDPDKLQARLTDTLKNFVGPTPQFSVVVFDEPGVGRWGAIVIPPSAQQPHVLIRDGSSGVVKHEWLVRVNDTTERAAPHDYTRLLAKAIRREVRPLELELQRLALRLEQKSATNLDSLAEALKHIVTSPVTATDPHDDRDLATQIRSKLVQDDTAVEEGLVTEALRLWEVMSGSSDANPWSFNGRSPEQLRSILAYLEEQTFPLAIALATIARHDKSGRYTQAVVRTVALIARQPEPMGTHYPQVGEFRLYPLVLCLYALVTVAAQEQRAGLLKQVLSIQLEHGEHVEPITAAFRNIRSSHDVFNTALEQRYFDPIPVRVRDEFIPRFSSMISGTPVRDAFRIAEFIVGLAYLSISESSWGDKVPMPGMYLYEYDAKRTLRGFLRRRPDWLSEALQVPLVELLTDFDANVSKVVSRGGRGDGFTSGAIKAYQGE